PAPTPTSVVPALLPTASVAPTTAPALPALAATPAAPAAETPASATATVALQAAPAAPVAGNAVRFQVVPSQSKATFRVREQLARLQSPSDAVGSTGKVTGQLVVNPDGTFVASQSQVTV